MRSGCRAMGRSMDLLHVRHRLRKPQQQGELVRRRLCQAWPVWPVWAVWAATEVAPCLKTCCQSERTRQATRRRFLAADQTLSATAVRARDGERRRPSSPTASLLHNNDPSAQVVRATEPMDRPWARTRRAPTTRRTMRTMRTMRRRSQVPLSTSIKSRGDRLVVVALATPARLPSPL